LRRKCRCALQQRFVREFEQLEDWEQAQLLSSLERVATMLDARDIDASPVLDLGAIDRIQPAAEAQRRRPRPDPSFQTDQK